MAVHPGDSVQYIRPSDGEIDWAEVGRKDPDRDLLIGDRGEVVAVDGETASVAWDFGRTTQVSVYHLAKAFPRSSFHRYAVLFENVFVEDDVTYHAYTMGGPLMAVHMATAALLRHHPTGSPAAIIVTDLGSSGATQEHDLIVYGELA